MKKKPQVRIIALVCCYIFLFANAYSQKVSSICVKTNDTLCRLISYSDTIYVTDADAHWTVEHYRHACYGVSEEKLSQPLWILHIKGDLCGKLSTLVCQRADYYERGNHLWKPMKRLKTVGNPSVDITLESADCQLLFHFED